MRTPSPRGLGTRAGFIALCTMAILGLAACGSTPPSVAPTVAPTPLITPDPHLADPTTADEVYRGLGASGLRITANNASAGGEDPDLIKRINATYLGWPLNVSQYRTSAALVKGTGWEPGEPPGQGEAPVAIAAANILVQWGPQTGEHPATPNERQLNGLKDLVTALDRLLSPLRARTVVRIDVPGVVMGPTTDPSGSSDATTADGGATPKP
jgi:hypothetical protein